MAETGAQNIKTFHKGQKIYTEGQKGSVAFMIKKGSVVLFRTVNGKRVLLDRLTKGEIFGEMSALTGSPRTTSAEAAEYSEILILTEQVINTMLGRCPKTVQHLTRLLIKRLRRATQATADKTHKSSFLSICRLLEMAWTCHSGMPPVRAKKVPHHNLGLSVDDFSRQVKDVLLVNQNEIDATLDQLIGLKLVEVTSRGSSKAFSERYVRIKEMETFFQIASNLHRELTKSNLLQPELEYIDIHSLADEVEADPKVLYKKMANMEIPESLFCFPRGPVLSWAEEQDENFFRKVKRRRKKIQDLEDVNDIVFVDGSTLKDVFARLGYYKLGVLLSIAGDEARQRILGNLARKIATIVRDEAEARGPADPAEAEDVQDELIEMIKAAKGVAP